MPLYRPFTFISKAIVAITVLYSLTAQAQFDAGNFGDEDLDLGGDIFKDFNEDLEATQVMEDERFYRYGRFFAVNIGFGLTDFTDNRGLAYEDNHPSYHFSLLYFMDFQNAFVLGLEFSSHTMFIDTFVQGSRTEQLGAVETSLLRPFIGYRYYIDTSDLGTAITYSNPYFVGRVEYWYQTNDFIEVSKNNQEGGGLGTGVGVGLEFPMEIKKSYLNVEFLYHRVDFFDKFTRDYRQIPDEDEAPNPNQEGGTLDSTFGFEDLRGDVLSLFVNYVINW